MEISKLKISNFRNIEEKEIDFNSNLNIIKGVNGFGKTSILESIFFSINLSSFRSSKKSIIGPFSTYTKISLLFDKINKIDILFNNRLTKVFYNNEPVFKYDEMKKFNNLVFFNPYDFNIVLGSMSNKRKMLNYNISQLYEGYFVLLSNIKELNKRKSILLKGNVSRETLYELNKMILEKFNMVYEYRENYLKEIKKRSNLSEKFNFDYTKPIFNLEELSSLELKYRKSRLNLDVDKLSFKINDEDIKNIASRGEIKKFIFEIFHAQMLILEEIKKEKIVVLIDDLDAELDQDNISYILNLFNKNQVIFTKIEESENE